MVKRQNVDGDLFVPAMAPALDVNGLPGVARKMIFEVERDHRRYHGIVGDDTGQPSDFQAVVVDDVDNHLEKKWLWERDVESYFYS